MPSTCRRRWAGSSGASCWRSSFTNGPNGWSRAAGEPQLIVRHPAAALALADDLARLMDDMITREVPWQRLDGLVPDHLDEYWQLTLQFLRIVSGAWPAILAERGAIEPAERRDRLIAAEARRLAAATGAPVIAAGSTGSMPATARLLATIAALPRGAVVLPGLDTALDDASWNLIGGGADPAEAHPIAGHPQFAMHGLLARIGITRGEVVALAPPARHGREILLSEALRPAAATDQWRGSLAAANAGGGLDRAMETITVIEAAHVEEEALAIAVALREALTVAEPHRGAGDARPRAGAPGRGDAAALEHRCRRFRRRSARGNRGRRVRAAGRRGGARPAVAGGAAGAAETSAGPARRATRRPSRRRRHPGAGDPARPAPASRRGRAHPCIRDVPRRARQAARQGSRR